MFRSKMKSGLLASLVLGAACSPSVASTTDLGPLPTGATPFFGIVSSNAFVDLFTFVLPQNGGTGSSVVNFPVSGAFGNFNTIFSSLVLLSNPNGIALDGDEITLASSSAPGASSLSLNWETPAGGAMILTVTGIGNGSLGGLYSGAISVSNVTPIPEPATWGMMTTGAILLGFGLRRKRS
jgi:hypothetical protein